MARPLTRVFDRIRRAWGRYVCWAGYIPKGIAVDPAEFPADEYPIRCLTCGYNLHALPDGRCPECGVAIARGHVLVETYYRGRRPKTDPYIRLLRYLALLLILFWAVIRLPLLILGLVNERLSDSSRVMVIGKLYYVMSFLFGTGLGYVVLGFVGVCWLTLMVILLAIIPPAKKRRKVERAAREVARRAFCQRS